MDERIRDYGPLDEEAVVELSLRAWTPVFSSLEQVLGREVFVRLYGDWRQYQDVASVWTWPPAWLRLPRW